jgi:hypothetical protein
MSNELTEAERAAVNAAHWYCHHDGPVTGTDSLCQDCENVARAITAAVTPIIESEITQHPDVNNMDRGFGNCPQCLSPRVAHCHECLNNINRDSAHAAGWRMDHIGGFGCIALCLECRNDNP